VAAVIKSVACVGGLPRLEPFGDGGAPTPSSQAPFHFHKCRLVEVIWRLAAPDLADLVRRLGPSLSVALVFHRNGGCNCG
jgi:hypothetical protein